MQQPLKSITADLQRQVTGRREKVQSFMKWIWCQIEFADKGEEVVKILSPCQICRVNRTSQYQPQWVQMIDTLGYTTKIICTCNHKYD